MELTEAIKLVTSSRFFESAIATTFSTFFKFLSASKAAYFTLTDGSLIPTLHKNIKLTDKKFELDDTLAGFVYRNNIILYVEDVNSIKLYKKFYDYPKTSENMLLFSTGSDDTSGVFAYSGIKNFNEEELFTLIDIARDIIVLRKLEAEKYLDPLTGLYNRKYFEKCLLDGSKKFLILFDIDHFKKINDTFGHPYGDEVIKAVAKILKSNTRKMDLTFRIGGEEFAVFVEKNGYNISERIRKAVENSSFKTNVTISSGVSFGTGKNLYKNADKALYEAKKLGRNRTVFI